MYSGTFLLKNRLRLTVFSRIPREEELSPYHLVGYLAGASILSGYERLCWAYNTVTNFTIVCRAGEWSQVYLIILVFRPQLGCEQKKAGAGADMRSFS